MQISLVNIPIYSIWLDDNMLVWKNMKDKSIHFLD
jgi:hypothetical protein